MRKKKKQNYPIHDTEKRRKEKEKKLTWIHNGRRDRTIVCAVLFTEIKLIIYLYINKCVEAIFYSMVLVQKIRFGIISKHFMFRSCMKMWLLRSSNAWKYDCIVVCKPEKPTTIKISRQTLKLYTKSS